MMDCTQEYLDELKTAYQQLLTTGHIVRVKHGDRETAYQPNGIKALQHEIARVERCLYRNQHGRNPPKLYRGRYSKGLR